MAVINRREQILTAAMRLFSEKGYHATSMRDIAEALGLQAGSLYVHIDSKEEVLFEIVDRAADQFIGTIAPVAAADRPAAERLREALRAHLQVMARNLDTATVFFHEWKFLEGHHRAQIVAKRDQYEQHFRRIVADGIESGEFRPVDVRLAALALLSMANWFYHWFSPDGPLNATDVADGFADLILEGLKA